MLLQSWTRVGLTHGSGWVASGRSGQVTKFAKNCAIFELSDIGLYCRSGSVFVK